MIFRSRILGRLWIWIDLINIIKKLLIVILLLYLVWRNMDNNYSKLIIIIKNIYMLKNSHKKKRKEMLKL